MTFIPLHINIIFSSHDKDTKIFWIGKIYFNIFAYIYKKKKEKSK